MGPCLLESRGEEAALARGGQLGARLGEQLDEALAQKTHRKLESVVGLDGIDA